MIDSKIVLDKHIEFTGKEMLLLRTSINKKYNVKIKTWKQDIVQNKLHFKYDIYTYVRRGYFNHNNFIHIDGMEIKELKIKINRHIDKLSKLKTKT